MAKRGPKRPLTDEHKAAMAEGRRDANAVKAYLAVLRTISRPNQQRRTADEVEAAIQGVAVELADVDDPIAEVKLLQKRRDLRRELDAIKPSKDLKSLEKGFVQVAARYSSRNGIDYETWLEAGVADSTLKRAGLTRSG